MLYCYLLLMTTFIRQNVRDRDRDRQDRYVQHIKDKKACSINDKYHTYTGMVQKVTEIMS